MVLADRCILLVHSPLVGPEVMQPLAAVLVGMDAAVAAPDLRPALSERGRPFRETYVELAARIRADVVIGHSGAGVYLPLIADRLHADIVTYIDAHVPDDQPVHTPTGETLAFMDDHTQADGLMAPWPRWWPEQTLVGLVPDPSLREQIARGAPRVPRRIYDESVPMPSGWTERPAAYLQTSAAYDAHRIRAERYGWPSGRVDGGHLDLAAAPEATAASLMELWATPHG